MGVGGLEGRGARRRGLETRRARRTEEVMEGAEGSWSETSQRYKRKLAKARSWARGPKSGKAQS